MKLLYLTRMALAIALSAFALLNPITTRAATLGVNLPWMDNAYDHDFGYNAFHPSWGVTYNPNEVETCMADLHAHDLSSVRIFLFGGFQGLTFDSHGRVNGLNKTFVANLKDFVSRANEHGVSVYPVFLDAYCFKSCFGTPLANGATMADIFNDPTAGHDLVINGMLPVVSMLKFNNVFGYDLINDANVAGNWPQVRAFTKDAVTTIHEKGLASARLTISDSQQGDLTSSFGTTVGGLGLDFYDVHDYYNSRMFSNSSYPTLPASSVATDGKPLVLGEFGLSDPDDVQGWKKIIDSYMGSVLSNGYQAAYMWSFLPDGHDSEMVDNKENWNDHGWNLQWWGKNKFSQ